MEDKEKIVRKLKLLHTSLPSLLKKFVEELRNTSSGSFKDEFVVFEEESSESLKNHKEEHTDEEDEAMGTALGCRQLMQFIVFYDEACSSINGGVADRALPDLSHWFTSTIGWVSQDFCDLNPSQSFHEKPNIVESILVKFFETTGDQFYCYLCRCKIEPIGKFPTHSCPICKGWFLVEASPDTDSIPPLLQPESFMLRRLAPPITYDVHQQMRVPPPDLDEESLHSIEEPIQCLICLEKVEERAMELSCGHKYCQTCIRERFRRQFYRRTCPTCSCLMLTTDSLFNISLRSQHFRVTSQD